MIGTKKRIIKEEKTRVWLGPAGTMQLYVLPSILGYMQGARDQFFESACLKSGEIVIAKTRRLS